MVVGISLIWAIPTEWLNSLLRLSLSRIVFLERYLQKVCKQSGGVPSL